MLGLTLNCARCHSHKYDPLPQSDYYRLVAVFKGAYDEYDWLVPQPFTNQWKKATARYLTVATPEQLAEVKAHNAPLREQLEELKAELKQAAKDKQKTRTLTAKIKTLEGKLKQTPKIRALWDRGQPTPTYLYRRGDETQPARPVDAGPPTALTAAAPMIPIESPKHSTPKTGRRLAFARWLVQPSHPLTSRVIVNRVWQAHFGVGIVKSLDNFGKLGTPPSHPELLDWLAVEFVENGWSLRQLHREIMTSTAYRQSSQVTPEHETRDPENRLLSRMPMRRMTAEELRDSLLWTAGKLDLTPFGRPDPVQVRKDGLVTSLAQDGRRRRSVYVRQRRKEMPSILETFDLPQMNPNCTKRAESTVVSQPLHLLNNKMVHELAGDFASRVRKEAGNGEGNQISLAWRLARGRKPSESEVKLSADALAEFADQWRKQLGETADEQTVKQNALRDYCHALLNSAGFLYID